jgi:hypothetical protein
MAAKRHMGIYCQFVSAVFSTDISTLADLHSGQLFFGPMWICVSVCEYRVIWCDKTTFHELNDSTTYYLHCMMLNSRMPDEWWIGKDLEGSSCVLLEKHCTRIIFYSFKTADQILVNRFLTVMNWPPLWCSGQRSWVRFPVLPDFLRSGGSGTGFT